MIFFPIFFSERPSRRNNESPTALTRSLSRSNSTRKKIIPSFEPLSESTESDSLEEQLQKSKEGRIRNHSGHLDHLEQNKPPAAVNIDDMLDEDIGDISSSSEIEIDEPLGKFATLFPLRGGIVFIMIVMVCHIIKPQPSKIRKDGLAKYIRNFAFI